MNPTELPKVDESGERPTPGSELPKMTLNLMGGPSEKNKSIEVSGTLSLADASITGGGSVATSVKPTKGPEELLDDAFNLLKNKPTDPEALAEAEKSLTETIRMIMHTSLSTLNSIDDNIQDLLEYFMAKEKEEKNSKAEAKKEKEKQDAEKVKAQKEQSVVELANRAEELEKQNKEKREKEQKKDIGFVDTLKYNLHQEMPWLFKDPSKDDKEDKDKKEEGGLLGGAAAAIAAPAVATGLSLGYLSDATGVSSFLSQNILGTSKEEADKAAAQRVETVTKTLDETFGVKRVSKKDGSLDFKKTWGFENPFEVAEDYLFRGDGPLAPTGSEYKERTTEMLKPNVVPEADPAEINKKLSETNDKLLLLYSALVDKDDLTEPTKKLVKASADHSKANAKKQMAPTVINNNTVNNITTQNASSVISNNYKGRGALDLAN